MASCQRKENVQLMFKANRPRFFKIILDDSERKLGIPRKFARMYGDYLSSPVTLKVPGGAKWEVDMIKREDVIWLQNGWRDFFEYYSLSRGSFLVFECEENYSGFNVNVFDKSTTEIDYPSSSINIGENEKTKIEEQAPERSIEEAEIDVSIEILGHSSLLPAAPQPNKKMKPENSTRDIIQVETAEKRNGGLPGWKKQKVNRTVTRKRTLTNEEKRNVIHRASTHFKSENPFFMIAMQPSYVHGSTKDVGIPPSFARKYLNKNGDGILNDLDGRSWPIKYCTKTVSGVIKTRIMSAGWRIFSRTNHLEVGNVCVFELIDHNKIIFRVVIFKDTNSANFCTSIGKRKQSIKKESSRSECVRTPSLSNPLEAIEAAEEFNSVIPFFTVVITSNHLSSGTVSVPLKFINSIKHTTNIKLQVNNRWWPVKLNIDPHIGKGSLSTGWPAFARENSLKVGDVCIFEQVNSEAMLIKVSISRHISSN